MTQGFIIELSDTDKDPGFFGQTLFGKGAVATAAAWTLLLVGLKADSAGTMTNDAAPIEISTEAEADAAAGTGGELARMAHAALKVPGIQKFKIAAVTPGVGAAFATATATISGTWTTGGTWNARVCGETLSVGFTATDTPTTAAAAVVAYVTARKYLPVTASNIAGAITFTSKTKSARCNSYTIVQDTTLLPSGCSVALAGGSTLNNGGKLFTGGVGVEDVTALLAVLYPMRFQRIAVAQVDATNLALWETHVDNSAGYDQNRTQHVVTCAQGNLAAATSIASSTLDDARFAVLWNPEGETPGPETAAEVAGARLVVEQAQPNTNWDDYVLRATVQQTGTGIIPTRAQRVSALDAGVTPITTKNASAVIVRGITTRCLTEAGGVDDRTVDWGESATPDWVRDDLQLFWETSFRVDNPHVRDNPAPGELDPESGIAFPLLWEREVNSKLLDYQAARMLTEVETHPCVAVFNKKAKRIASRVPTKVLPLQHQMELSVEQIPYAA